MEVRRVDPRDTEWEEDFPTYRVYFFTDPGPGLHGWTSDEFELKQAEDVQAVIDWSEKEADGRTYIIYVLVPAPHPTSSGLLTLLGHDPNRPTDPRRRPNELK
jgi:hypothetical protein